MPSEAELNNLIVRLTGDGSSYQKMLTDAQHSTEQTASQVEAATKRIEGMQSGLQRFAGTTVAVLGGLGLASSLTGAFEAFEKFENAQIRLRNSIEASGRSADVTVASYKAFASQIVDATTASKGEVFGLIEQAERMQITGDAAQRLVTNAIALGAATGKSAQEGFRAARAMEMGNMQQLRFALGLRGVTDEAKIQAIAQQMLTSGWKTAQEQAATAGGQIEKLQRTFKGLNIEVGGVVAEMIQPVVKWLTQLAETFKHLTPESKKMVVTFVGVVLGILAVGPAVSTLTFLLGPLGAAFSFVAAAAGFVLSPLGLVVTAILATGLALTDTGTVVSWFGRQWIELKNYIQPAIDGMANAVKAGNLALAFQIAWVQIKLVFFEQTAEIRGAWDKLTTDLARGIVRVSTKAQEILEEAQAKVAEAMIHKQFQLGFLAEAEAEAQLRIVQEDLNNTIRRLRGEAQDVERMIDADADKAVENARAQLEGLRKQRDDLVADAKKQADAMPVKVPLHLDPKIPKIPTQTANVKMKFDAVAFASAEARGRIAEFMEKIEHPEDFKKKHGGAGGAPAPGKFEAAAAGGVEGQARQDRQVDLLGRIAMGVENLVQKPVMPVVPADIA